MFPIKRDNGFRHIHRQLSCSTLFMASVFREVFSRMTAEYSINATALPLKRKRRRGSAVSDAEMTTVVMPFHSYSVAVRCVFIPGMREAPGHLFPETVSHNRFYRTPMESCHALLSHSNKVFPGKCVGVTCRLRPSLRLQKPENTYLQYFQEACRPRPPSSSRPSLACILSGLKMVS